MDHFIYRLLTSIVWKHRSDEEQIGGEFDVLDDVARGLS